MRDRQIEGDNDKEKKDLCDKRERNATRRNKDERLTNSTKGDK